MEPFQSRSPRSESPVALGDHARDNIRFIRETMERAGSFTAVSGWGGVAMGITALGAAVIASRQVSTLAWLVTWLAEAAVAIGIALWTTYSKARAAGTALFSGPGRRFVYSFAPPLFVGVLLTILLARIGSIAEVAGVWLLLYGTAIVTGGAFSVRVVPVMGICLMTVGAIGLVTPAAWGDAFMAAGFGVLQIVFGVWIARNHGG